MPKQRMEIREFEAKFRHAVDEFFEDYKARALIRKDEYPLTREQMDWYDVIADELVDLLRIRATNVSLIVDNTDEEAVRK